MISIIGKEMLFPNEEQTFIAGGHADSEPHLHDEAIRGGQN